MSIFFPEIKLTVNTEYYYTFSVNIDGSKFRLYAEFKPYRIIHA